MHFINNQKDLNDLYEKLSNEKILSMDTEFQRRTTYYPILSIIQISAKHECFIVDALSDVDLDPIRKLLINPDIIKIFHSAQQDFEIFLNIFKELPKNVFDTQVAAGVCGMDPVMGYARLCNDMLHVTIDKTMQKADWLVRPLPLALLKYAELDTKYLLPLYQNLARTMDARKLWDNYEAKISRILSKDTYKPNPEKILSKIYLRDRSPAFASRMLHLIAFREECAQKLDIPKNFCASDEDLIELAKSLPTNETELSKTKIQRGQITKPKFRTKLFELCEGIKGTEGY